MGYFDKDYLEHHQILGAKWGKKNGPPYPLGSGDHSASEKRAASAAGIKVGKDSGKGSIENVKKKKKAPLTEEEKRLKAEEARLKGDSKNISKYMDKLTTDELKDAKTRADIKKGLAEAKESKAEKDKKAAMLSGDREKVMANANKMTYEELKSAMDKVDYMAKLTAVPPKPTTMDKIDEAMKKVDKARDWMDKGLKAYDALAAINNTFNKDHKWPRAEFNNNNNKDQKKEDKLESIAKKIVGDAKEAKQQNDQKSQQKQSDRTENKRIELEDKTLKFEQQKYNDQRNDAKKAEKAAKEEAKEAKKAAKAEAKEAKKAAKEDDNDGYEKVKGKEYPPDRDIFNTSDFVDGDYRDLSMDSPSSAGEQYLNRYLLEDKRR